MLAAVLAAGVAGVAWWAARDTCPSCHAVVSPSRVDSDGAKHYSHDCNGLVEWGAYSPADCAGLEES